EQEEEYGLPEVSEEKAPLYEHCARAVDHGLRFGPHGLPLMGTGDWNDGMNLVGPRRPAALGGSPPPPPPAGGEARRGRAGEEMSPGGGGAAHTGEGRGESVWNGWFLLSILPRFADLAERRGDRDRAARYREQAARLKEAMEGQAWDGAWYRRAYFD